MESAHTDCYESGPCSCLQRQTQTQAFNAQLLLPVTQAKGAQGTSQDNLKVTGRTPVLNGEIRDTGVFSAHQLHKWPFALHSLAFSDTLKASSSARIRKISTTGYKISLRATIRKMSTWRLTTARRGLVCVGSCLVPITCQIWWWSSQSLSGETSSRAPCPRGWPRWSSVGRAPGWGKEGPHTVLSRLEGERRGWLETDRRGTAPRGLGTLCHSKPLKNCSYSSKDFCYLGGSEEGNLFQQVLAGRSFCKDLCVVPTQPKFHGYKSHAGR